MSDLTTTYLGMRLKNPIVVSSSPLTEDIKNIKRMEDAGAAAVVLHSLFEEQIELQNLGISPNQAGELPDGLKRIADLDIFNQEAGSYLSLIYRAKEMVDIPIIGSLNGYYSGSWANYGRLIENAGADALELNVYYLETKPQITGIEIEQMHLDLARKVRSSVSIPVAIKLSPYFSAMAHMAGQLDQTGINGLVIFNRFYQPDFDLKRFKVKSTLALSSSSELRLRLRWAAILSNFVQADLAITGGVHTVEDIVKCMLAGAKVAMITSALYKNGIAHISQLLAGLRQWLRQNEFGSVKQLQGKMSLRNIPDPSALERANYMRALKSLDFEEDS